MKNKYIYYCCIILLICLAIVLYKLIKNRNVEVRYKTIIMNEIILQKSLLDTPLYEAFQINDSIIRNKIDNKIVCLFPSDICDLCYENIFNELSLINDTIKSNMVMIVPAKFTRNYKIYDQKYNINIKNIIFTKNLQDLSSIISNNILMFYFDQKRGILSPLLINKTTSFLPEYVERVYSIFIKNDN